jgi:hypothetical protein
MSSEGISKDVRPPVILLVDWNPATKAPWLAEELRRLGFPVTVLGIDNYSMRNRLRRSRKFVLWWQYSRLAWRGVRKAKRDSAVVLSWNFIPGAIASALCQIPPLRNTPVVSLNLIAFNKNAIHGLLRRLVYAIAASRTQFLATVNTPELRLSYVAQFRMSPDRLFVLRDCWAPDYPIVPAAFAPAEGYVFSGGEAARDWPTLLTAAKATRALTYRVSARRMNWDGDWEIPPNAAVQFDTSEDEFYQVAARADFLVLPLEDSATAGLIVLLRAALLGKAIVCTHTSATRPYFPEDLSYLLVPPHDPAALASACEYLAANPSDRNGAAALLQAYILRAFSPEEFARRAGSLLLAASGLEPKAGAVS